MPFVKKIIHLSSINLYKKIIPNHLHLSIDDHQKILMAANNTANNLVRQARIKSDHLIQKTTKKIQQREIKIQKAMSHLIEKSKQQSDQIKHSIAEKTQQEVWQEANALIHSLNQAKQNFFNAHHDFFKSILSDLINALVQDIHLKTKLEIIAQKVIEKAKGLEEGIIYFNQADLNELPEIKLPLNWKILADDDIPHQTCKLHAQGSDWYVNFNDVAKHLNAFFQSNNGSAD